MKKSKDLEYFKNLNYNAVLKQKDGLYYLFVPELSLIAQGQTPDQAWQNLESKKNELFQAAVNLNLRQTIREPAPVRLKDDLMAFLIKIIAVGVLFLVALNIVVRPYSKIMRRQAKALSHTPTAQARADELADGILQLTARFSQQFEKMSDEQKQQAQQKFKSILQDLKPFVDEIRLLFEDASDAPKTPDKST